VLPKELGQYHKVKRNNYDDFWYTHKRKIANFEKNGFYITEDLLPLTSMFFELKKSLNLSKPARQRLKWMDYYLKTENVALTCRHFDIARKTFYKWHQRYDPKHLSSLEDQSKAPIHVRQPQITPKQEMNVVALRKQYLCYSKIKLAKVYLKEYNEPISSWKIQRVIQKHRLYPNPQKIARITRKRLTAQKKKRITELKRKPKNGFLICLDAIELRLFNLKRFIFTGIDSFSKVAFARMYKNANSYNAADFLNRLLYLIDGHIDNLQTDNGSEFEKYFRSSCNKLGLQRYYSRPHTPKDNPVNERFNKTLQDEFINLGNAATEPKIFNQKLTEWLIEYNFKRPHQALNYETPINFNNSTKVSPMYPSSTNTCVIFIL
jgi:transposase-like protein